MPAKEKILLASFSPKGAISMALVMTAPRMLNQTFGLDLSGALSSDSLEFMADVVCGTVLISMLLKSFFFPRLHRKLLAVES